MHAAKEELRRRAQEACAEVPPVRSLALETLWSLLSLLERSALSPCQFDWRKNIPINSDHQQKGKSCLVQWLTRVYASLLLSLVYASLVGKPRKPRFGLSFILCHRRNYRNKTLFVECSAFNCSGFFYNLLFLYFCSHPKNYRNCNYTKLFTQTIRKYPGTNNPHFFFLIWGLPGIYPGVLPFFFYNSATVLHT